MSRTPYNLTISLTQEQYEKLESLKRLTRTDDTHLLRAALEYYYEKVMEDEEGKELAKINAFLDVQ